VANFGRRHNRPFKILSCSNRDGRIFLSLLMLADGGPFTPISKNKVEDEVFWQNHATYEKFACMERLPSRSEISRDADDLAQQLIEAEVPSAVRYFAGIKHDVWGSFIK
jgi:hypothetical protein